MTSIRSFDPIASFPLVHSVRKSVKVVRRFHSRRFIFAVRVPGQWRKVFQVIFNRSDGSIFVNIPYSALEHGILSEGRLPRLQKEVQVSLEERGKVTSKLVKYAHHPDGRAHFSQSGQVRTEIVKQSVPLTKSQGHIFTLQFQGVLQFDKARLPRDEKPPTRNRTLLTFNFESYCPLALKFVGWWHHVSDLGARTAPGDVGPHVTTQKPDGTRSQSFLVGPLKGDPLDEFVMVVTCEPRALMDPGVPAALNIIGGFGELDRESPLGELSFICASYPASDYRSLVHRIGSIDLDQRLEPDNERNAG